MPAPQATKGVNLSESSPDPCDPKNQNKVIYKSITNQINYKFNLYISPQSVMP
jgi:hypothetical protein